MEKIGQEAYVLDTSAHSALLTSSRLILVDSGSENTKLQLRREIMKCGYKVSDIQHIIITHVHQDHIGGLAMIKEESGARTASHILEAESITKKTQIKIKDRLVDSQIYQGLLVIHTPGHTKGNIALLDQENGLLVAGDSFRSQDNQFLPMPDHYNLDTEEHKKSMKKLLDYSFDHVIVGHGHPIHFEAHKILFNSL
ncbi:MBL fold metallo-hydrolase [Candidatus Hodarchaeum mangrovi]